MLLIVSVPCMSIFICLIVDLCIFSMLPRYNHALKKKKTLENKKEEEKLLLLATFLRTLKDESFPSTPSFR